MWIDLWYCCTIINTNGYMCVVNTAECLSQAQNGRQQLHVAYSICGSEYSPFSLSLWSAQALRVGIYQYEYQIAIFWGRSAT